MNIRQVTIIEQARSRVVALPNPGPVRIYSLDAPPGVPSPHAVIEPVTLQPERVAGQEFVVHPDVDEGVAKIIEGLLAERDDWERKAVWSKAHAKALFETLAYCDQIRWRWNITALTTMTALAVVTVLWWLS